MKRNLKISTIQANKALDKALRYLYASLVYLEVHLMAIRFKFNEEEWEADTIEEAIALRAKLEYSARFSPDPHREMDKQEQFWTPDRFKDVIDGIGELQHQLLMEVHRQPNIPSDELRQRLRLDSEVALAGVISGLSKQLKQLGIEPKQVFVITVHWLGKKKQRFFILNDFFTGVGAHLNWPDAWEQAKLAETFGSTSHVGDDPDIEN
jgi:hypothetical protein